VIREFVRYLYRPRAAHDGECRSLKALTPSIAAQLDSARGSVESRELSSEAAALAKVIEQTVRANEGRRSVSLHEPGVLEGRRLLGTLRLFLLAAGATRRSTRRGPNLASVAGVQRRAQVGREKPHRSCSTVTGWPGRWAVARARSTDCVSAANSLKR
jgi:hypothetical protein